MKRELSLEEKLRLVARGRHKPFNRLLLNTRKVLYRQYGVKKIIYEHWRFGRLEINRNNCLEILVILKELNLQGYKKAVLAEIIEDYLDFVEKHATKGP